jgi:hypothetical protein
MRESGNDGMLIDGEWCRDDENKPDILTMRLGDFFLAVVKRGQGDDAGYWIATLNGRRIGAHEDKEWAQGCAENEICNRLYNVRHDFGRIKKRAPTGTDLYGSGGWERFKAARQTGFE